MPFDDGAWGMRRAGFAIIKASHWAKVFHKTVVISAITRTAQGALYGKSSTSRTQHSGLSTLQGRRSTRGDGLPRVSGRDRIRSSQRGIWDSVTCGSSCRHGYRENTAGLSGNRRVRCSGGRLLRWLPIFSEQVCRQNEFQTYLPHSITLELFIKSGSREAYD